MRWELAGNGGSPQWISNDSRGIFIKVISEQPASLRKNKLILVVRCHYNYNWNDNDNKTKSNEAFWFLSLREFNALCYAKWGLDFSMIFNKKGLIEVI